ncbi:MAG: MarR family transcriptional regulator [Halobacteria archaeon]|nr:MarR family transcriptional regulator [Halobacteria archaeon]
MSIDIERFENETEDGLRESTNAEKVIRFLAENNGKAWKQSVIAERADVNPNSVGSVLSRLQDKGLVRHKGEYWAITDDKDRLESASQTHNITEALNERYGTEDKEEWLKHAVEEETE